MKITSKGQVTIPQAVRDRAGMKPLSEVEFEVRDNGEVVIRSVVTGKSSLRSALERARGTATAPEFKDMNTEQFMHFLRG
jgi:AbrB family looped-hinge helix DNA binding protein